MTSSGPYSVIVTQDCQADIAEIKGARYLSRNSQSDAFDEKLAVVLRLTASSPLATGGRFRNEPLPNVKGGKQLLPDGWRFRKLEVSLPGVTGDSGQGRLMYLVDTRSRVVYWVMFYTHREAKGRPDERILFERIKRTASSSGS